MVHASVDGGEVQVQFRGEDTCKLQLAGWLPPGQPDMVLQRTSGESLTINCGKWHENRQSKILEVAKLPTNNIAHNLHHLIANKEKPPGGNAGGYRGWGGSTAVSQKTCFPYFCVTYFSVRTFNVAKFFKLSIKSQ